MAAGINDWTIDKTDGQNILFYKEKNYIPRNTELRGEIVQNFHDHEKAGHPGEIGMYNAVRQLLHFSYLELSLLSMRELFFLSLIWLYFIF